VEITHRWSRQTIEPADGLSFVGKNPGNQHVSVATGFSGQHEVSAPRERAGTSDTLMQLPLHSIPSIDELSIFRDQSSDTPGD
jgi:hypothetical protein